MPAINNFRISLLVIVMILASLTDASAAPDALKGKTITIVWTEVRQEKLDSLDSNTTSVTVNFTQKTYVSEIGRAFTRMTRVGGPGGPGGNSRANAADQGPTDQNSLGSAGVVSFSGQRMTVTRKFSSGARQVSAVFDGGFTACRAQIVVGKQGNTGFLVATSMRDRKEYIYSSSVSGESCSVAVGNGFSQ